MKKIISLTIALCLVLGSFSFVFADFSTTDSSNLTSIKNSVNSGGALYSLTNQINNSLKSGGTLYSLVNTINSNLNGMLSIDDADVGRTSVTWWVREAVKDLDQIVGNGSGSILNYLDNIYQRTVDIKNSSANTYTETHTIRTNIADLMDNYMPAMRNVQTTYLPKIYQDAHKTSGDTLGTVSFYGTYSNGSTPWSFNYKSTDHLIGQGLSEILKNDARFYGAWHNTSGTALNSITGYSSYNGDSYTYSYYSTDHLLGGLYTYISQSFARLLSGYGSTQTSKNWLTLNDSTFTAVSATDGIYKWLQRIQTPIARLAYVHASDEEIEARNLAAANQDSVVDNFINPQGNGSVSTTNISSISDLSSGYKSNFGSDASISGIFNIFNSNNMGWFSSETYNQLDTTNSNRKSIYDSMPDTPLLDKKIDDIYEAIGLDNDR